MAYFVIKYIGQAGNVLRKPIEALTREEAISRSGIPSKIIQGVEVDHIGAVRTALTQKRLPLNEQVLALVTIASKLEAGSTPGKSIMESVDAERIGVSATELGACEIASDYLKTLRFDDTAVLLAEAGVKAGNLADSLKRAAAVIRERVKSKKEFAKPMKAAAINFAVGVGAGIGFPIFGGNMMHSFLADQKLPIQQNMLSHVLMWLSEFYMTSWPIMLVAILAAYSFRRRLWDLVRHWPIFNLFDNRIRCRRGLDFVQTYQLLTESGSTGPQVIRFLLERSNGHTRVLYEECLQLLTEGRELGLAFDGDEWPRIIAQNLKGFEQQTLDNRSRILSNLTEALSEMFVHYSEKIASAMSLGALIVIISSILLFALGFYVPLMTMRMTM